MTFAIELLPESERNGDGDRLAEIRVGDFRERVVVVPLPGQSITSLPNVWRCELRRLLTDTDAVGLRTQPQEAWILYRSDDRVFVQNQLLAPEWGGTLSDDGKILEPPARQTQSDDGTAISEWDTSTREVRQFLERCDADDRGLVGVVRGNVVRIEYPRRCAAVLTVLAVLAFVGTGEWVHGLGVLMVLLGVGCATPTMNMGNGCLLWLATVVASVVAWTLPAIGLPLVLWGVAGWLCGSIECRLTMRPHEKYAGQTHRGGNTLFGVSILAIAALLALTVYIVSLITR